MENKIKRTRLRDDFFAEIATLSSYADPALVETIYYSMVKTISRQIKAHGQCSMPDWGRFYLHTTAPRIIRDNVNNGDLIKIGSKNI